MKPKFNKKEEKPGLNMLGRREIGNWSAVHCGGGPAEEEVIRYNLSATTLQATTMVSSSLTVTFDLAV